jgi:threonine/homoserine/homoserine lactone efflux protein
MFGLSLVTSYLLDNKGPLRLIGGVFLIAIGVHMVRARHPHLTVSDEPQSFGPEKWRVWLKDFTTGFGLTIINPATLVGFAGVFAGLGLFAARLNVLFANYVIVLGVFVGSALWWTTLTSAASTMRHHLPVRTLPVVNVVLGILVAGCGVLALLSGFGMIPWLPLGLNGH